jgi:dTDP-4-dehydrorhamnose 3,5-epimerase
MENTNSIVGVIEKQLIVNLDHRGYLMEAFRMDDLPEGLQPLMSYISFTQPGCFRGPHEHLERVEMFVFPGPGNFRITIWDNRKESITYKKRKICFAGENNPKSIIIYPGIVHVVENISNSKVALLINYPNTLFKGWGRNQDFVDEIKHNNNNDIFWEDFLKIKNSLE